MPSGPRATCTLGLVAALLSGTVRPCAAQTHADFAQQRYDRGVEAYRARHFDAALDEFRASLELFASPNTRLYAARCLAELGRLPDAVLEFERTIGEATERALGDPRYAPTRETATSELAALQPRVARVTVTVPGAPAGTRVRVGDREVPAAALGLPMVFAPGSLAVHVEAPGSTPVDRVVDAVAGQRTVVAVPLTLPAVPIAPRPAAMHVEPLVRARRAVVPDPGVGWRIGGSVVLGLGGAALVSSGLLFGLSESQYATLDHACPNGCVYSDASQVDRGEALQTGATVALGVGIAAAVVGTVMIVFAPHRTHVAQSASW